MKIITWNVNGLRALHRKELFLPFIKKEKPDILCLQETKAEEEQLSQEIREINGYHSFFASSRARKGYSGVGIYSKEKPKKVLYGIGNEEFDREGRTLVLFFNSFVLINCYFPNGGGGPVRLDFKMRFYDAFLSYIKKLRKQGHHVLFCGDINTAHEEIDLARPKENEKNTGFLPEERAWIDEVVYSDFVDIFRHLHPHKEHAYTYWDMKTRARERNVGWRIDYFFANSQFLSSVSSCEILSSVLGSDHCPIVLGLKK